MRYKYVQTTNSKLYSHTKLSKGYSKKERIQVSTEALNTLGRASPGVALLGCGHGCGRVRTTQNKGTN